MHEPHSGIAPEILGVLQVQVERGPKEFFALDKSDRKPWALELLREGIESAGASEGWRMGVQDNQVEQEKNPPR